MAWAVIPKASFDNLSNASMNSTKFWFERLKTRLWKLCLALAIDWPFPHLPRKTPTALGNFSQEISNVVFFSQLVEYVEVYCKRFSNSWNFSGIPLKIAIVIVSNFGSLEILLLLLLKLAVLLLFAKCWGANSVRRLRSFQRCLSCGIVVGWRSSLFLLPWWNLKGAIRNFLSTLVSWPLVYQVRL